MKRKEFIKKHILPYEDDKAKVEYYEGLYASTCCDAHPLGEVDIYNDGVILGRCISCKEGAEFYEEDYE